MNQKTFIVIGAGHRGRIYSRVAKLFPDRARIVGIAEPNDFYRDYMVKEYNIPLENVYTDWKQLAGQKKIADAVIIATQDKMHAEPAVAFANLGYHIMLEKPMATTETDCRRIVDAVIKNKIIFAVCHVMRYTNFTHNLKSILDSGVIGDIVTVQHLENVGYWHQAHSYVRGNWRNEQLSSPMLLAKSCHDMDWLRYIMNVRCRKVSSFGYLTYFKRANQPKGAADRCFDCNVESTCPYSAIKIYLRHAANNRFGWPVDVVTHEKTYTAVHEAIKTGPYGRCVFACDNNVVDNQVVNLDFDGDRTCVFTMTAFNKTGHRKTRIFGTRGEIYGDGLNIIERYDFLTDKTEIIDLSKQGPVTSGHGGGDNGLAGSFLDALIKDDPSTILSGPKETLESHLMVFAAEKARKENRVVDIEL
ncbi:MAG: Gfo/Idh/MocA family oxidoreductase [Elusimicrobiota bacterium]